MKGLIRKLPLILTAVVGILLLSQSVEAAQLLRTYKVYYANGGYTGKTISYYAAGYRFQYLYGGITFYERYASGGGDSLIDLPNAKLNQVSRTFNKLCPGCDSPEYEISYASSKNGVYELYIINGDYSPRAWLYKKGKLDAALVFK